MFTASGGPTPFSPNMLRIRPPPHRRCAPSPACGGGPGRGSLRAGIANGILHPLAKIVRCSLAVPAPKAEPLSRKAASDSPDKTLNPAIRTAFPERPCRKARAAGETGSGFSPFAPCLARHPRLLTPPTTGALPLHGAFRRGGRVVECTALEMRHRCKPIGGSNPSLSASPNFQSTVQVPDSGSTPMPLKSWILTASR